MMTVGNMYLVLQMWEQYTKVIDVKKKKKGTKANKTINNAKIFFCWFIKAAIS